MVAWLRWGSALVVLPFIIGLVALYDMLSSGPPWLWLVGVFAIMLGCGIQCLLLGYSWQRWIGFAGASVLAITLSGVAGLILALTVAPSLCRSHAPGFLALSAIGIMVGGLVGGAQGLASPPKQRLRWLLATAVTWLIIFTLWGLWSSGVGPALDQCTA